MCDDASCTLGHTCNGYYSWSRFAVYGQPTAAAVLVGHQLTQTHTVAITLEVRWLLQVYHDIHGQSLPGCASCLLTPTVACCVYTKSGILPS